VQAGRGGMGVDQIRMIEVSRTSLCVEDHGCGGFRVIAPDMPGFGRSGRPACPA
jgi:pimeloyl-ACP methyl ester carboxylesterase